MAPAVDSRRVGLLRAVNLGGHNAVKMADLRAFLLDLGLSDAQTLLQTGNLIFSSERTPTDLEDWLEREAASRLGLVTTICVRTAREWREVVARNPFPAEAEDDPAHLVVCALKHKVGAVEARKLSQEIDRLKGPERVQVIGRHAYLVYPAGIGESKLTAIVIERALGTPGTARNWNTVRRIAALL